MHLNWGRRAENEKPNRKKSKSELFLCSEVYVLGFRHFCMAEKLTRLCGKKSVSHCFLVFVNIYLTVTGHSKQITHSLVKQVYL